MHCYWFEVDVAGPVTEHDIESLGDRLSAADGIDASVQADDPGETVMFSREAEDAVQAVISAVHDVEAAGMRVTGVADDRVTVHEIADRARVSAATVRYWISGTVARADSRSGAAEIALKRLFPGGSGRLSG